MNNNLNACHASKVLFILSCLIDMLLYNRYYEEGKNTEQDAKAKIQTEKDYAARKV